MGLATHIAHPLTPETRALLDALPDPAVVGSVVRDAEGHVADLRVEHLNAAAQRAEGLPDVAGPELFTRIVRVVGTRRQASFCLEGPDRDHEVEVARFGDGFLALLRDVTRKRRAEARLRANEARLAEAQRVAHLGVWEWNVATGEVSWTDELFRIYGITPADYRPSYEGYIARVHPEDREHVAGVIAHAARSGLPFTFTERIVRPDGSVRTLRSGGRVRLGPDGRAARMLGVCHDMTDLLGELDQKSGR